MFKNLTILNSKEVKAIKKKIIEQWGACPDLEYAFLKNNQEKIYIVNREISEIDLDKMRVNHMGMYFCKDDKLGIRLSIEGSQIIGKAATKNVFEISKNDAKQWMFGEDLECKEDVSGFVIIRSGDDFLGAGKYSQGRILNYVNKARRVSSIVD